MQLPIEPRKIWALTKRDIYNWSTYKNSDSSPLWLPLSSASQRGE